MESSKRQSYTAKQRKAVLADVRTSGVIAAAKKHHVPQSCVSRWASAAGVTRAVSEKSTPPVTAPASDTPLPTAPSQVGDGASAAPTSTPVAKPAPRSRVAKLYSPSQKAVVLEDAAKHGVTAAAKQHGISRFSIYDWQRRVTKAAAGEGPSPTSGPAPKDIEQQRDAEILAEWNSQGPCRNNLVMRTVEANAQPEGIDIATGA